ncbi:hypothetical protein COO60DRAFT_1701615 [Scenedesmus sp. NREL 46B-D3]|nr:hypothetical protein COO60DRAFT_1701615 [Scenedesmus sp. NREL 46B-D3]
MTLLLLKLTAAFILLSGTLSQIEHLNANIMQPLQQHGCSLQYQPGGVTASMSPAMQKRCQRRYRRRKSSLRKAAVFAGRIAAGTTADGSTNPLLASDALPNWDQIMGGASKLEADTAAYIVDAVTQLAAAVPADNSSAAPGEEVASLLGLEQAVRSSSSQVGFNAVVAPLTQMRLRLESVYQQIDQLEYLSSDVVGDSVDEVSSLRTAFEQQLLQSSDIYAALLNMSRSGMLTRPEEIRVVRGLLQSMQAAGAGQPSSRLARLNDIERRLANLHNQFMDNLQASQEGYRQWVRNPALLDGLPQSVVDAALQNALDAGAAANQRTGPWLLKFDGATADYVVAFASNRQLRQAVFNASVNVASQDSLDNSPVVVRLLMWRQQKASLLGFRGSFAQFKFARLMANLDQANTTMYNLAAAAKRKAQAEIDLIVQFAAERGAEMPLQPWDVKYWRERYKREVFRVDEAALRDYLLVDNVLDGMFQMASRLYGVTFTRNTNATAWDAAVISYSVYDGATNALLGMMYFDLYTRKGKDFGGYTIGLINGARFWRTANPVFVLGSKTPFRDLNAWLASAPRQLPVATLALNQANPNKDGLALMWLDEVGYLFHEFGHGLHHILTTTPYGLASGCRNIEFDAAETVSMMQEKWAWDKDTFLSFARHYKTGEQLSEKVYENVMQMRGFGQGIYLLEDAIKAIVDIKLHSSWVPGGQQAPDDVFDQTYRELAPVGLSPPGGKPLNSFDHIFGGFDYESAYYSYWWSDMMASDIYLKFQADGAGFSASNGRLFRSTFFAQGGALSHVALFRLFMGRSYTTDAAALTQYYNL